ncbi:MAG: hypothetical protein GWO79_01060, partial [Actinobacteria bacterium]|nr:hypothetical protein [Actinomycetota bacterium]
LSISKDLEMLARTYSNISSSETGSLLVPFKAKQIVSEALVGMTSEEISKIEKRVENLLMMGIKGNENILEFLDIDSKKGGMGMNRRTAENLANKINGIVREIELLVEEENKLKERKVVDSSREIVEIRQYLLDAFDLKIESIDVLKILDRTIKERVANRIDRAALQKKFDQPIKKGGVGLDRRTAKKMAQRLELLVLGKYK